MSDTIISESFDDHKYKVVFEETTGKFYALRYGEKWRELTGDGLVLSMLFEVARLRRVVGEVHSWIVCAGLTTPEDMAQNFLRIEEITREGAPHEPQ